MVDTVHHQVYTGVELVMEVHPAFVTKARRPVFVYL